jgi:hypothetical protein
MSTASPLTSLLTVVSFLAHDRGDGYQFVPFTLNLEKDEKEFDM